MNTNLDKLLKDLEDHHLNTLDMDATHDFIDEFINDGINTLLSIPEVDKAVHAFIFHPDNIEKEAQRIMLEYDSDLVSIPYMWIWDKLTVGSTNDE